jgi:hypothetical protein
VSCFNLRRSRNVKWIRKVDRWYIPPDLVFAWGGVLLRLFLAIVGVKERQAWTIPRRAQSGQIVTVHLRLFGALVEKLLQSRLPKHGQLCLCHEEEPGLAWSCFCFSISSWSYLCMSHCACYCSHFGRLEFPVPRIAHICIFVSRERP